MQADDHLAEQWGWLRNRHRAMAPRHGRKWCHGCDCYEVADGAKCPICGRRNGTRRKGKRAAG